MILILTIPMLVVHTFSPFSNPLLQRLMSFIPLRKKDFYVKANLEMTNDLDRRTKRGYQFSNCIHPKKKKKTKKR